MIFLPEDLAEESKIRSLIGKFLSWSIFNNSEPTAPDEPKIATFKALSGKKEKFLTLIQWLLNLISQMCITLSKKFTFN